MTVLTIRIPACTGLSVGTSACRDVAKDRGSSPERARLTIEEGTCPVDILARSAHQSSAQLFIPSLPAPRQNLPSSSTL